MKPGCCLSFKYFIIIFCSLRTSECAHLTRPNYLWKFDNDSNSTQEIPTTYPLTTEASTANTIMTEGSSSTSYYSSPSSAVPSVMSTVYPRPLYCPTGTRVVTLNDIFVCEHCPSGTFSNRTNSTVCTPCSPGSVQPNNRSETCIPCAPGHYQDQYQQLSCKSCTPGYYCSRNECSSCDPCPAGFNSSNSYASESCVPCPIGWFKSSADVICRRCPDGFYNQQLNASTCRICPSGYYCPCTSCLRPCPTNAACPRGSSQFIYCSTPFMQFYTDDGDDFLVIKKDGCVLSVFSWVLIVISCIGALILLSCIVYRMRQRRKILEMNTMNSPLIHDGAGSNARNSSEYVSSADAHCRRPAHSHSPHPGHSEPSEDTEDWPFLSAATPAGPAGRRRSTAGRRMSSSRTSYAYAGTSASTFQAAALTSHSNHNDVRQEASTKASRAVSIDVGFGAGVGAGVGVRERSAGGGGLVHAHTSSLLNANTAAETDRLISNSTGHAAVAAAGAGAGRRQRLYTGL